MDEENKNTDKGNDKSNDIKNFVLDSLTPKTDLTKEAVSTGSAQMLALIISVCALVMAAHLEYKNWNTHSMPKVAVVDESTLNTSIGYEVMQKACKNPKKAQAASEQRVAQLAEVISNMRDSGYVVINKSSVMSYPAGNDITEAIADEMDLELVTPEFAAKNACEGFANTENAENENDSTEGGDFDDGSFD